MRSSNRKEWTVRTAGENLTSSLPYIIVSSLLSTKRFTVRDFALGPSPSCASTSLGDPDFDAHYGD